MTAATDVERSGYDDASSVPLEPEVLPRERSERRDGKSENQKLADWFGDLGTGLAYSARLYRTAPEYWDFGNGPEMVKGWLRTYTSPVDEESVQAEWGGGEYVVNLFIKGKSGLRGHKQFSIPGIPKPLPADRRRVPTMPAAAPGVAPHSGVTTTEQPLLREVLGQQHQEHGEVRREARALGAELREERALNARLAADLAAVNARLAALEQGGGPRAAAAADREHERELLKIAQSAQDRAADAQTKALEQMASTATQTLREAREALHARENTASEPLKQYIAEMNERHRQDMESQRERHKQEMENVRESNKQMLAMFEKQSEHTKEIMKAQADASAKLTEQRMADLKADLERLRTEKKSGIMGDLGELGKVIDVVGRLGKRLGGRDGDDDRDVMERLMDAAPDLMNGVPALAAGLRHLLTGEPLPVVQVPPQLPEGGAEPGQPAQGDGGGGGGGGAPAPERTVEEREAIEVLQAIYNGYERKIAPADLARSITSTIGTGVVKRLIAQPVDDLIEKIAQRVPELGGMQARLYLRSVREAFVAACAH